MLMCYFVKIIQLFVQLLPLYVLDAVNIPGIPGLFTACLFSGALRYAMNVVCTFIHHINTLFTGYGRYIHVYTFVVN